MEYKLLKIEPIWNRENPQIVIFYPNSQKHYTYHVTYGFLEEIERRLIYRYNIPKTGRKRYIGKILKDIKKHDIYKDEDLTQVYYNCSSTEEFKKYLENRSFDNESIKKIIKDASDTLWKMDEMKNRMEAL